MCDWLGNSFPPLSSLLFLRCIVVNVCGKVKEERRANATRGWCSLSLSLWTSTQRGRCPKFSLLSLEHRRKRRKLFLAAALYHYYYVHAIHSTLLLMHDRPYAINPQKISPPSRCCTAIHGYAMLCTEQERKAKVSLFHSPFKGQVEKLKKKVVKSCLCSYPNTFLLKKLLVQWFGGTFASFTKNLGHILRFGFNVKLYHNPHFAFLSAEALTSISTSPPLHVNYSFSYSLLLIKANPFM